jgi:DNA-binding MarR family transcriptional regulator
MDEEALRAWVNLWQTGRIVEDVVEDRLVSATDLSLAQYEVLMRLAAAEGGRLRMLDVANLLLLSKSGMTRLIDRLVEARLVERTSCPSDRRVVYAHITNSGRDALEKAMAIFKEGIEDAFVRHLSDADVRALRRALRKVIQANGRWEEERCSPRLDPSTPA